MASKISPLLGIDSLSTSIGSRKIKKKVAQSVLILSVLFIIQGTFWNCHSLYNIGSLYTENKQNFCMYVCIYIIHFAIAVMLNSISRK